MDETSLRNAIRNAIRDILGSRPGIRQRRELAALLRTLAEEQERLADAQSRQQRKPPGERVATRQSQAGPGRPPGELVRIERRDSRLVIYIGRQVFYALGQPERLDVQTHGSTIALVVTYGDRGFAVSAQGNSIPRIRCSSASDIVALDDGWYEVEVQDGRIIVGAAVER